MKIIAKLLSSLTALLSIVLICFPNFVLSIVVAVFLLICNIYAIFKSRNNLYLLFIFVFILYCNFSICFSSYIMYIDNFYTTYYMSDISSIAMGVLALFNSLILLLLPLKKMARAKHYRLIDNNKYSLISCVILLFLLLCIFIFGYTRTSSGARGVPSTLYEYSIILFILLFYYSGKNKTIILLATFLLGLFVFNDFVYGGRITGLQLLLVLFFSLFINKIKKRFLLLFAVIGVLLLVLIGASREGVGLSIETINYTLSELSARHFTLDTSYAAYHASLVFVDVASVTSTSKKIGMLFKFFASIIVGPRNIPDSNVSTYTQSISFHGGGGLLPFYGFYYLGIIGVTIIALYVFFLIKTFNKKSKNKFIKCLAVYFVATLPRWYLYSPLDLFRGFLIFACIYGAIFIVYSVTKPRKKRIIRKRIIHYENCWN